MVHGLCCKKWSMMVCVIRNDPCSLFLGTVHGLCHQEWSMVCVIRNGQWSVLPGMVCVIRNAPCHQEWSMICGIRNGPWSVS